MNSKGPNNKPVESTRNAALAPELSINQYLWLSAIELFQYNLRFSPWISGFAFFINLPYVRMSRVDEEISLSQSISPQKYSLSCPIPLFL